MSTNMLISPREVRFTTSLSDQTRLGPNTIARFDADILFTSSLAATWTEDKEEQLMCFLLSYYMTASLVQLP